MAESKQKQWIVLLNKSPRGPLLEFEIKGLLKQGTLRHNDLAFLVPETAESGQAPWKFLWQFPEFDSRVGEKTNPPPAAVLEKRSPKTEEQIKAQVEENVPVDLKSITIDDLILKVNTGPRREVLVSKIGDDKEKYQPMSSSSAGISISSRTTSALFAVLALVGILYAGFKEFVPSSTDSKREVAEEIKRNMAPGATGVPKARTGEEARRPNVAPPAPMAPKERERGEVREDEILRMREEERRREAAERERERAQREAEEKDEDAAEEDAEAHDDPKPKKKETRKTASEEGPEGEGEGKPGSAAEDEAPPASWIE